MTGERVDHIARKLKLPVIAAPMFLVSGPDLVIAASRAGIMGTFPAANARTVSDLESWLDNISTQCGANELPWAVNLIVHSSNDRLNQELALVCHYKPPVVISALGSPERIVDDIHGYGGFVFADVSTPSFAQKAVAAGVDGLVLVCSGAGGHTGQYSPFAFIREVRQFWTGPVVLAGAISDARGVLAAQILGADFVYMGTRFIAAKESLVSRDYRQMIVDAKMEDIVTSNAITGVNANWLRASLRRAGLGDAKAVEERNIDFSAGSFTDAKAWKNIWSAGQGVGAVEQISPISDIVAELEDEYSQIARCGLGKSGQMIG